MGLFTDSWKDMSNKRYIVRYIDGIESSYKLPVVGNLVARKDGIENKIAFKNVLTVDWNYLLDIKAESQGEITERISLNKAAIGYFFFGPLGALAAARNEKKDERSFFVTIYYLDKDKIVKAYLIESKQAYEIFNDINKKWETYCRDNNISISERRAMVTNSSDIELQKLIQQKAKGKISSAEFEAKKRMLSRE